MSIGHHEAQHLIHRDALEIDVEERALDGFELPVDDHGLCVGTVHVDVEDGVVTGLGVEDALHLLGIDTDGHRVKSRAIKHGGDESATANPPGSILVAAYSRLCFYCSLQSLP